MGIASRYRGVFISYRRSVIADLVLPFGLQTKRLTWLIRVVCLQPMVVRFSTCSILIRWELIDSQFLWECYFCADVPLAVVVS